MWYVYIIERLGKYYVGVTTDLRHRMTQHCVKRLLYSECHKSKTEAIARERQIKGWNRQKKELLIHSICASPRR